MLQHTADDLRHVVSHALALAQQKGATAAEADVSESLGQGVHVRLQEIEQIEFQQDKSLDITVYVGQRKGRASTADFSERALHDTVQAALDIARYTAEDAQAGLADADLMATDCPDLDKYHEWTLSTEAAIELAKDCEQTALSADAKIQNSDGAGVQTSHFQYAYGNTHGFLQHQRGTRHSVSCSVVASDGQSMERDYWYDVSCDFHQLQQPDAIGKLAAERTVRRLGARSVPTGSYPIVFDATVSGSLMGYVVGGLSGTALYRESSFLMNTLGKQILPDFIDLREDPHIPRTLGSTYFDGEGVATKPRFVIANGVVQGYFLSSYSARKLGMTSTGHAGGAHNLFLNHTHQSQSDLLREMGTGLLITELMGQGVNMLTGDYSRGAVGFWVENGVIAYPVSEITIAGQLQSMLMGIVAVANDGLRRSANKIGSILVDNMMVAGS